MKLSLLNLFVAVFVLSPFGMLAQKDMNLVKTECDSWRGIELNNGPGAHCFKAAGAVQELHVDSAHATLYALIRESKGGKLKRDGYVVAYDLDVHEQKWVRPFDFIQDRFYLADTLPIHVNDDVSECLDRVTGKFSWSVNVEIELITNKGVGIGTDYNAMLGVDLRNGKELWRKSGKFEGVEAFEIHGDTTAIFLAKGLHMIDLRSGEGFVVKAKTLEGTYAVNGATVGAAVGMGIIGGLVGGLVFGVAIIVIPTSAGNANQRADNSLTSIYVQDEHVYFSSRTEFYKVNTQGDVVWQKPVEKEIGPSRKVFVANDIAYLISKGIIHTSNGPLYGDAVLYQMNVDGTGPIRGMQLNTGSREYVQDFLIKDSTIVIAMNNKLLEISLDDLRTVREESFGDSNQNAGFGAILNPPAILFADSGFVMAAEKYPDDFFVENSGGMKIRFSEELKPAEAIREKNYFAIHEKISGQRMFITNGTDVYLVDSNGKRLNDFSFSSGMKYVEGKVFDFEGERIVVIDGF